MKKVKEFSVIKNLQIFSDGVIHLICAYMVLNYDIEYARKLYKALKTIPNFSNIKTYYFKPETIFLLTIYDLALKALQNWDSFDCKTWNEHKGRDSNPDVNTSLDALYMLKIILTGNFSNSSNEVKESDSKNLITYITSNPGHPSVDVSPLLQNIQASLSLVFKVMIINQAFLEAIMGLNSIYDYNVNHVTYGIKQKIEEADKSVNYFLSYNSFLNRNRCMSYSKKDYVFALTTSESKKLKNLRNTFYDPLSFENLKLKILEELNFYQELCQEKVATCCAFPCTSKNARLTDLETEHLKASIQASNSWSALEAVILSSKKNACLKNYNNTWESITKLFEDTRNELPFIEPIPLNFHF